MPVDKVSKPSFFHSLELTRRVLPNNQDSTIRKILKVMGHIATLGVILAGAFLIDMTKKFVSLFKNEKPTPELKIEELTKKEKAQEAGSEFLRGLGAGAGSIFLIPQKVSDNPRMENHVKWGYTAGFVAGFTGLIAAVAKLSSPKVSAFAAVSIASLGFFSNPLKRYIVDHIENKS
ncbi:MAG: hypothetical protein JXA94_04090 [Parachlamydiales bacterium]|nr:hypothetical protein [Parachlamydiales bacterium]